MSDFVVALGLVFVIEGLVFAAFPGPTRRAVAAVLDTPDQALRLIGLFSAMFGLPLIWAPRGLRSRGGAATSPKSVLNCGPKQAPCFRSASGALSGELF